jgi:hypothetical protein
MEVRLEANAEETTYILLTRHQNVRQNRNIKKVNRSLENVVKLKYFGITTNQNLIHWEITDDSIWLMLVTIQSIYQRWSRC